VSNYLPYARQRKMGEYIQLIQYGYKVYREEEEEEV
jgi:hypothetical protein